jgi:DNA mismatch repair protein MutH
MRYTRKSKKGGGTSVSELRAAKAARDALTSAGSKEDRSLLSSTTKPMSTDPTVDVAPLSASVAKTAPGQCVRIKIAQLHESMKAIVGVKFNKPVTRNKGEIGTLLEKLTGIPQSSACLDCEDGELKALPVKRGKDGKLVPKETVAVTMINRDLLKEETFENSRVFKKLSRTLYDPYERDGDNVSYMEPTLIDLSMEKFKPLYDKLKRDYDSIRAKFIATGELSSRDGAILQNRTKGIGHGSTSRAFYLKKEFITEFVSF